MRTRESRRHRHRAPFSAATAILQNLASAPALGGISPEMLAALAKLAPTLRVRFPHLPRADVEPDANTLATAVRDALEAASEDAPVLMLCDALSAADAESRALMLSPRMMCAAPCFSCSSFAPTTPAKKISFSCASASPISASRRFARSRQTTSRECSRPRCRCPPMSEQHWRRRSSPTPPAYHSTRPPPSRRCSTNSCCLPVVSRTRTCSLAWAIADFPSLRACARTCGNACARWMPRHNASSRQSP